MDAEKFLKKFEECVVNFRKVQQETADDHDLAHFMDPTLKKFLLDNKDLVNIVFRMNSLMPFQKLVTNYLWKKG